MDLTWTELADVLNAELRDPDEAWSESAYRKKYQQAKAFYDEVFSKYNNDNNYLKEMQLQMQKLEKEKVKTRDERTELRRILREEARKESYKEQLFRSISEFQCNPLSYDDAKQFNGVLKTDNDLICGMMDIHAGLKIDNFFNKYDEEVLRDRFNQYLDKIFEVQLRHGSENAYVILSELVSGIIHLGLRIENNQDLIQQFLMVTNYLAQFLSELSYHFNDVHVYCCPGNHGRISARKDESMTGENIDLLAIPFLRAKLQNFYKIHFHDNKIEQSMCTFSVRGNTIFGVHGDKDSPQNVVQKLTLFTGIRPDIIYMGHRHTNAMETIYNVKVIQNGCMSGSDSYCMDNRLRGNPEETISVITDKGLDCIYDVKFN